MEHPEKADHKSRILLFIEIGGDLATAVAKFVVGIISNSSAVIAEGFHSLADTTNQIFLLIGIENSKKPADSKHPFGYGMERFFWAFLSALFIMLVSGGIAIWQGIEKVLDPTPVHNFGLNFLVLGIAFVFQFINLFFSSKRYRTLAGENTSFLEKLFKADSIKEPTAINLWLGDWAAVGGNFIAALALFVVMITGNAVYDGLASIVIGLGLVGLGLFLAQDAKKLLVGEAVTPAMYEKIVEIIRGFDEANKLIKLKTMHLTPNEILINADIDFIDGLTTEEIDRAVDDIETELKEEIPAARQISIEVEVGDD